jgi:coenzyme F420-0:L-glutamate ligase / coenzyme F420-1:gamma-L-glutamate ligase
VELIPLLGMPEVQAGEDLAALVVTSAAAAGASLVDGDIVVVSSKVVSKSLGLWADSSDPGQAVAGQTVRVVAERRTGDRVTRVVESVAGPVMAAAGVDASNTGGRDALLLLPVDPDAEAQWLRQSLLAATGLSVVGVVVSDTAGRPWRAGQTDFALGAAGLRVVDDLRGGVDADGRLLGVTTRSVADELAAAADLVKGKADAIPAAIVRGAPWATAGRGPGARSLVRTGREDWFAYGHAEAIRSSLGVPPGSTGAEALGIPDVVSEPVAVRVERAAVVAGSHLPFGSGCDTSAEGVLEVSADTAYQVGVVAARAQVALWGEGFHAQLEAAPFPGESGEWRARLVLTER